VKMSAVLSRGTCGRYLRCKGSLVNYYTIFTVSCCSSELQMRKGTSVYCLVEERQVQIEQSRRRHVSPLLPCWDWLLVYRTFLFPCLALNISLSSHSLSPCFCASSVSLFVNILTDFPVNYFVFPFFSQLCSNFFLRYLGSRNSSCISRIT